MADTYGRYVRERTAVKEHDCSECREPIQPGDRYFEITYAPWYDFLMLPGKFARLRKHLAHG